MNDISLRPRTLEHVKAFWEESQDEEIGRLIPLHLAPLSEAIEQYAESQKPDARSFGRVIYVEDKYVGDVWCYGIDEADERQAFVSIVIFDKAYWGKGIGKQVLTQFCQLAFEKFRIDKLCAFTYSANQRSIGALERVGFCKIEEFTEDGVPSCYFEMAATTKTPLQVPNE